MRTVAGPILAERSLFLRYGTAVAFTGVIALMRFWGVPILGVDAPFLPFVLVVFGVAWLAGLAPALAAVLFSTLLAQFLFVEWKGRENEWLAWVGHISLFVVISSLLAWLVHRLQRSESALRLSLAEARAAQHEAADSESRMRDLADALQVADKRKDEFLAMLAHELRNPLVPLRNIGQIFAAGNVDEITLRRAGELLRRQTTHLARLVDDLLDVARITCGKIELQTQRLEVAAFLRTALEISQPIFESRQQSVRVHFSDMPLWVNADPTRLGQIFGNLLSNAAKYSPPGATIHVDLDHTSEQIAIRIRDSGVGIDATLLPQVFDLFVQADRSLDRSQGGLGVGLTIVKHLVELHGGSVTAHSDGPGTGSEFIVRLPAAEPAQPELPQFVAANHEMQQSVLIVEDNRDSAASLALLLEGAGHQVHVTHDAAAALLALESFSSGWLLIDIGLPDMDGYRLAQSIRSRYPERPLCLYALTGYGRQQDRELALQSGFDGHLTKPVDPQRLLDMLAQTTQVLVSPQSQFS